MELITFILDCPTFGGYTIKMPVYIDDTIEKIVIRVLTKLERLLIENNLFNLISALRNQKYYISENIEDIIFDGKIIFIKSV